MKRCTLCSTEKDLFEFNKRQISPDGLQNVCRDCNRSRSRAYYRENKEKHLKVVLDNKASYMLRNRKYLADFLAKNPCVDCGISDIRVLEFDHVRGSKVSGVADMASRGCSLENLQLEIDKCEVRCRNCHVIKTYERLGGSWHNQFLID